MSLRVIVAVALLVGLLTSQGVEQATEGRYKTPGLISDLSKIAVGGMFGASGLAILERMAAANRRRPKKPPSPTRRKK